MAVLTFLGVKTKTPADLMARERDGRFAAGFDRVCVCGHTLGEHAAENPKPCFHGDFATDGTDCDCQRFKRAKGT